MKKILRNIILFFLVSLIFILILLSSFGIETSKFNNLISNKISQNNKNIDIKLSTIKFKFDIKEISLFLETIDPKLNYRNVIIPTQNIKVYLDFLSLIKSDPKIGKVSIILKEIDIKNIKKISTTLKPSNFKNFIKNNLSGANLKTEIDFYLNKENLLDDFIARGSITKLNFKFLKNINFNETSLDFLADKNDVLVKNISSKLGPIQISEGDLKFERSSEILVQSNFKSKVNYNSNFSKYSNLFKDFDYINYFNILNLSTNNSLKLNLDNTYKLKNYNFKSSGKILKANADFKKPIFNYFLKNKINNLSLIDNSIDINFEQNKLRSKIQGNYSFNNGKNLKFDLKSEFKKDLLKLNVDAEVNEYIDFKIINYEKPKDKIANVSLSLNKKKDNFRINKMNYVENDNQIIFEGVNFTKDNFLSLENISVKTTNDKKTNNDFKLKFEDKIIVKGDQFDASNLPKFINQKSNKNILENINKEIEIEIDNILVPLSEKLNNFKLIGIIQKGEFVKITSKGEFKDNNFLDILMKQDKNKDKKYLEIYSDLTKPLLTEFDFFQGLSGGKLLYTSEINKEFYISNLKIENFKVINAPGLIKLLSLADLGGLVDLAQGDGLSFDILEINFEKNKDELRLKEIIALGPSISVIMEGYQNTSVTSLRGTLIPAKTLNKMISKIPVIGDIVIPKEVGEGMFGISFKMKGPKGKIKTTINPIRTITPRFIQKIIDKKKLNNFN